MPKPATTPLLRIENLTVATHGNRKAPAQTLVHSLSFSVNNGETLCIVGESGSGKTISALALMNLLPDALSWQADTATLGGQNLLGFGKRDWRRFRGKVASLIFQEPLSALNPVHTVGKQVLEVLQTHAPKTPKGDHVETVLAWFAKVQLPDPEGMFHRFPHQLSGGQRQRVMIAMAMCTHPKLLIADEPTTALDAALQRDVLRLMQDLQKEHGTAIVFITHDFGVVKHMADHVLVLENGHLVEAGTAQQVLTSPKAAYTQKLIGAVPRLKAPSKKSVPEGKNPQSKPLLHVEGLSKTFSSGVFQKKHITALDNVGFTIQQGEFLGVLGESGSGKSTLAKCLTLLEKPDGGRVALDTHGNITAANAHALRLARTDMQMVFQDPMSSLNPRLNVADNITEGLRVQGMPKAARLAAAEALLAKVDLTPEMTTRYPHQFSGGQRQRICIARALAVQPKLLIADEATSALDVTVQKQVMDLLNHLRKTENLTILFISHDIRLMSQHADRLLILKDGQLVEQGTTADVLHRPQQAYTQELLENVLRV